MTVNDKNQTSKSTWAKLAVIDKRILYWVLVILLVIPYLYPIGFPITVSQSTRDLYEFIDTLGPEDVCVFTIDGDVSGWSEILPGEVAIIKHFLRKGVKIVVWGGSQDCSMTWDEIMRHVPEVNNLEYGVDYVYIGFLPGGETTIKALSEDIHSIAKADAYGTPISELKLMETVRDWRDVSLIVSSAHGETPLTYSKHWYSTYEVTVGGNVISMEGSSLMPYYQSGQLVGMAIGVRGGGEYEYLIQDFGLATTGLDALNVSHLLFVAVVIIANIGMVMTRMEEKRMEET